MNTVLKSLTAATLLLGSAHVLAASSVDLTVKGLITPSACTPTLSNGGAVDYGKISAKDLKVDQQTFLDSQTVQFTVTCDAATLMAMEAKDNREGSDANNDEMEFGLGLINGTEKLGGMELRLLNPVADSVPVATIGSYDGGVTWGTERNLMRNNLIAPAVAGVNTPIPVQLWTADLNVMPFIAKTSGLTLTNEVAIDGSVTLTVRYL
ncbi:DUF1120 domain-containing protein [Pseudomonas haemolytica]|uniref:DUF1120 domain-containing protein n=1 Tax=Pseudomonas haemolytica TaxID=2600065 RepID=A0A5P1D5L2_9PSED|nr:DUF1120 domain-containing protein [Pseudomonas haemolytica]MBJ2244447.1 DUF1120 domain-containing protein [Pseudomonas haemolytica]MBJ2271699.1 DUF1120 domain-containing protein [Pseudomonas haemolytica]MBK3447858.1 DUF1120 domain-containing protein [Pseudomonas haemolytica]MBK3459432.1 DUF1120 domain-containing protein [Pseudomonas haemolytica]MRJ35704.1 DUF1120 domain-containing protein [Pseudomonas haemolytica]